MPLTHFNIKYFPINSPIHSHALPDRVFDAFVALGVVENPFCRWSRMRDLLAGKSHRSRRATDRSL